MRQGDNALPILVQGLRLGSKDWIGVPDLGSIPLQKRSIALLCCISPDQHYVSGGAWESPDTFSALPIGLNKGIMGWGSTNLIRPPHSLLPMQPEGSLMESHPPAIRFIAGKPCTVNA